MPRENNNVGVETTPNFDGRRESILNDAIGKKMGIKIDKKEKNPYNVAELNNEDMKEFEELMRGNPVDNER